MSSSTSFEPEYVHARAAGPFRLSGQAGGGFRVEDADGAVAVEAVRGDGPDLLTRTRLATLGTLARDASFPGGYVIEVAGRDDERLVGRTTREGGQAGLPATLLARDGRLFRIVARPSGAFELVGQEAPGAYLRARLGGDAFTIERTIAGRELSLDPEILLLFAAEILEAGA